MDYATKKIPLNLVGTILKLKALLQLKQERKVTEGEVIALALAKFEEELEAEKRLSLVQLAGMARGKAKSHAAEIDKLVYGV